MNKDESCAIKKKISWGMPSFGNREIEYINDAVSSTWISGGKYVDKFEELFAEVNGSRHCLTASNGTTAIHMALMALGIGPGDEVIVPDFTFVACANIVLQLGAKPVYADVDKHTWCLDADDMNSLITEKTKAVIPVHIYGNVCDMKSILETCEYKNIFVVEDVAEAIFSKYNGKFAGTFGVAGCFSFQATKTITMGEGGAVISNNSELMKKMEIIRSHGMAPDKKYWHEAIGHNFRLTNFQAAIGLAQLEEKDRLIKEKKRIYDRYVHNLKGFEGVTFQHFPNIVEPVVWAVAVRLNENILKHDRKEIMNKLKTLGIETRPGFYPCSTLPLYDTKRKPPVSNEIYKDMITLPSHPGVTDEDIDYICRNIMELM